MKTVFAVLLSALLAGAACADTITPPRFEPVPLPSAHVYSGGWEHFVGGGVAVFDCNGDGFDDLFMAGGEAPAQLFINTTGQDGAPIAMSQAALDGVDPAMMLGVVGAYPLDIDADGALDLAVLRVGRNVLLKGGSDCSFTDASEVWGFDGGDRWTTAFTATWEAGQERPTLAFGNYVDRKDPDGPFEVCDDNEVHRPDSAGYTVTLLTPGYCALSMLFSDWNRSGTQDLRVSNDRHYYVRGGSEQMWKMPELTLREGDGWNPISIWGMGIASQDITGDGRPEVVLTSMGDQLMQIATDAGYEAAPFSIGSYAHRPYIGDDGRPSTGWHAQFGDVNNDGRADLFIAKGNVDQMPGLAMKDPNNMLMQNADGSFAEFGDVAGIGTVARSRGAMLADLNRDGLLDLVVVNRRAEAELYQNVTEGAGGWLSVSLLQPGGNVHAVGAWVELKSGQAPIQTREVTVGGGHVSGYTGPLHFGLGEADEAQIRVIWPDGTAGDWFALAANRHIQIER